jgi:hypothetical protein
MIRLIVLMLALVTAAPAWAQQRPLQTEDPETIGAGRLLLETGVDYERDVSYPLSGLHGNLLTIPPFGVSVGVSSIAEIQLDWGIHQSLSITEQTPNAPLSSQLKLDSPDKTSDVDDLNIGVKVRFLSEAGHRPSMAFRFSTRLPNTSNESGLGTDMQDFHTSIAIGKTVQSLRVVANIGFLILGNPTELAAQDDLLAYSLSLARAVSEHAEIVGEFVGRANFANITTPGAEDRGLMRFGARYTVNGVRIDGGLLVGLTPRDPSIGFTGGLTWVFNAFKVP